MALSGVGKTGRNHPGTSHLAAVSPLKSTQQQQLLDLVEQSGTYGITCYEAWPHMGGISRNQIATRMMELREDKLVYRLKATRPTTGKNHAHIHVSAAVWQALQPTRPSKRAVRPVTPQKKKRFGTPSLPS
jgi:hypothetical protein